MENDKWKMTMENDKWKILLPSAFCLLPSAFRLLPSAFCLLPTALSLPAARCTYESVAETERAVYPPTSTLRLSPARSFQTLSRSTALRDLPAGARGLSSTSIRSHRDR